MPKLPPGYYHSGYPNADDVDTTYLHCPHCMIEWIVFTQDDLDIVCGRPTLLLCVHCGKYGTYRDVQSIQREEAQAKRRATIVCRRRKADDNSLFGSTDRTEC